MLSTGTISIVSDGFMNPTKIEQVKNIALSGKKMPQKSTYFYPKLLTGLVINKIE